MADLIIVDRAGGEHRVAGESGLSIMEIIRDAGFDDLLALCGGCCSCATCHVYVDAGAADRLPPVGEDESDLLESSAHRTAASRLSCQIVFTPDMADMRVTIAPED